MLDVLVAIPGSSPLEIAAIVAGIYRLIDMGSTTINVMGDLVWTTILSDLEDRKTN